jgi:hypothetical protein
MALAVEAQRYRRRPILHTVRQRHTSGVSHLRGRRARLRPSGPRGSFSGLTRQAQAPPQLAQPRTDPTLRPGEASWAVRDRCSAPSSAWRLPHARSSREVILQTFPGWVLPPVRDSRLRALAGLNGASLRTCGRFAFDDLHSRGTGAPDLKRRIAVPPPARGYGQLSPADLQPGPHRLSRRRMRRCEDC